MFGRFVPGANKSTNENQNPIKHSNIKTPAELRIQKEMTDIDIPKNVELIFPDKNNFLEFKSRIKIVDKDSYWYGATYDFLFKVSTNYPNEAPKIMCLTKIYHPNIDLKGNICLNILKQDWSPILGISVIIFGLLFLFYEPNTNSPLNLDAANVLRENESLFISNVKKTLQGKNVDGEDFPKLI